MDMSYAMSKGLYLILILSLLPVLVATAIGLIIGLLQTVTQIQEQTLPFGLKLVAVFICLLMQAGWLTEKVIAYATEMFNLGFSAGI
ncbi:MAG TPA: type III secretion system export apparatus subunit SctS [Arsenophonus nasoniae]|uniref:Type III secretion system export apparatus subunit SctS n=1 Tax=Arsenophonus nasoniae TaxID=638 RepID=A0AA95K7Q1_9GAMM|nr:type III secretion system export apparatus subunit SctS [Arsenophonus nasoniae]WGL95117.1 type III secretion system export apparatus subunit SctS [Arsenophonus nasoniae]